MIGSIKPPVSILDSVKICLKGYFNFKGRGRRSEFWPFYIIREIIFDIFYIIILVYTHEETSQPYSWITITNRVPDSKGIYAVMVLEILYSLGTFLPLIAASTRRLHDAGSSGLWFLCYFIPIAGYFIMWFLWCRDSTYGANVYGPATKYTLGMNDPLLNNPNVQPIFQNPIVQPGYYPQQNNQYNQVQVQPQPNINQGGERINEIQQQPININQEEIPINKSQQSSINNEEQIQINPNPQQPTYYQGQQIPVAQPNMYPQVNPQSQPQFQQNLAINPEQNPPPS